MTKFLVNNPKKILTLLATLTIYFGYYAYLSEDKLIVDFSLEQMFPENDIEREKYEKFRDEFSREDDKFLLIYSCDDPLSKKNITKVEEVTDELEWIDGIEGIISLSNIEDGDLFDTDLSDSVWASNKQFVLNHPIYANLVISGDGKSGAIFADLEDDIDTQFDREKRKYHI